MHLALLAFPALALAVIAKASPLEPRQISPDGSCGGSMGYTCSTGNCCSQFSYWCETACHLTIPLLFVSACESRTERCVLIILLCIISGSAAAFCGTGCQPLYGACVTTPILSPDGSCGGTKGYVCTPGNCCSQYGYWYVR